MKIRTSVFQTIVFSAVFMPVAAFADGELVSFGDGERVTERVLPSGQNMVATLEDSSVPTPSLDDEFGSAGVAGPNRGEYVDPSTNT